MTDELRAAFDAHAKETRKTLSTITDKVGELVARVEKVETGVRDAKHAAERAKMDGEGQQHALVAAFNTHKHEIAKALTEQAELSAKRRRDDRKFYLQMAVLVMPLLTALLTRGAQEIGRPQPIPVTLAPTITAPPVPVPIDVRSIVDGGIR